MLEVGDKVIINDNVRVWVRRHKWRTEMNDFIGKTYFISDIKDDIARLRNLDGMKTPFNWPLECLDLLEENVNQPSIKWYKKGKFYTD